LSIEKRAVGRAEIADEVGAARAPNLRMMARHAFVREDQVIVLGGADTDSTADALLDRRERMGADQLGSRRVRRLLARGRP
jgi:hypothetical protein